jgi:hypothetical protein
VLLLNDNDFGLNHLGLSNVAQVCKQDEIKNYGEIVTNHFEALIRSRLFDAEFEKMVDDYDKIKDYLGVRLYQKKYADHIGEENTIGRNFAEDLYAMLVFDLPDSIVNVKPNQSEKWGKSFVDLYNQGIQNIKARYDFHISQQKLGNFSIWFVQGDHFFTPNIVFDLENHPALTGSYGSIICMPHRHAVLIYPIENIEVLAAVNGLIPVAHGMYMEGPGSVSDHIFWLKDGEFENLSYKLENDKLDLFPPANFVEMLNQISQSS